MNAVNAIVPMALPFLMQRTRAYFAPVNRMTGTPAAFDAAAYAGGTIDAPWVDLGWVDGFDRKADSKINAAETGTPAVAQAQIRENLRALVSLRFLTWSKLSMALATSSQHMNLLAPAVIGSGEKVAPAAALQVGSTANVLYLPTGSLLNPQVGSMLVVDDDYTNQNGFVGAGAAGGWVRNAGAVQNDPDYIRRVSLNVGRVVSIASDGGLQLASPLIAGAPTPTMKAQQVVGFVDREGGSFFPEWSALFVVGGIQGEKVCYYYPRLQPCRGATESTSIVAPSLDILMLDASFRALPIDDERDGAPVLCYRNFFPATSAYI